MTQVLLRLFSLEADHRPACFLVACKNGPIPTLIYLKPAAYATYDRLVVMVVPRRTPLALNEDVAALIRSMAHGNRRLECATKVAATRAPRLHSTNG